jgi:hypothetical protein
MTNNITIDGHTVSIEFPDADKDNESAKSAFIRDSDQFPIDKLGKYYLNENLNFLCGSGTSATIGGKTINKGDNPFTAIIEGLKATLEPPEYLTHIISYLESTDLLEKKFDKINQEYLYYLNIRNDAESAKAIKLILEKILQEFVNVFVPFPIEYVKEKLETHELFINKIISRKETLSRPKIFTPNYDLAFENACEKIGVSYNNGFRGVHMRKFDPDTFHNETYIKQETAERGKRIATYLNIYKLHGSISWQYTESLEDLYNLKEIQISDTFKKEDFQISSLMIYPIQTKKSYSLDLPYSEIFRNFSKCLTENQNTLITIGYSFLDEHINDIVRTGLYNPNLTLIIHSFGIIDDKSPAFLQTLKSRSASDLRIVIFEGELVGSFNNVVRYLIPLNSYIQKKDIIIETLKELSINK